MNCPSSEDASNDSGPGLQISVGTARYASLRHDRRGDDLATRDKAILGETFLR